MYFHNVIKAFKTKLNSERSAAETPLMNPERFAKLISTAVEKENYPTMNYFNVNRGKQEDFQFQNWDDVQHSGITSEIPNHTSTGNILQEKYMFETSEMVLQSPILQAKHNALKRKMDSLHGIDKIFARDPRKIKRRHSLPSTNWLHAPIVDLTIPGLVIPPACLMKIKMEHAGYIAPPPTSFPVWETQNSEEY